MKTFLTEHLDDLMFFGGLALVGGGLAFIYWPLALIVPGACLVIVGLVMGLRGGR